MVIKIIENLNGSLIIGNKDLAITNGNILCIGDFYSLRQLLNKIYEIKYKKDKYSFWKKPEVIINNVETNQLEIIINYK